MWDRELVWSRIPCQDRRRQCDSPRWYVSVCVIWIMAWSEMAWHDVAGTKVESGVEFRNNFHLWDGVSADFFVRSLLFGTWTWNTDSRCHVVADPEASTTRMFTWCLIRMASPGMFTSSDADDCSFSHVVEGANLFVTEGARDVLQDKGVVAAIQGVVMWIAGLSLQGCVH